MVISREESVLLGRRRGCCLNLTIRAISVERVGRRQDSNGLSPEVVSGSRFPCPNRLLVPLLKLMLPGKILEPVVAERFCGGRPLLRLGIEELFHKVCWASL